MQIKQLSKREQRINNYIYAKTLAQLEGGSRTIGCEALDISLDLQIDRANISRILNKLNKDGLLTKQMGRPVLYCSRQALQKIYGDRFVPAIIDKAASIIDFISVKETERPAAKEIINPVGFKEDESLSRSLERCINTIAGLPAGNNLILYGAAGSGKTTFARQLFAHSLTSGLFQHHSDLIEIECLEQDLEANILSMIDRPANQSSERKLVLIKNFDGLSHRNIDRLSLLFKRKLNSENPADLQLTAHTFILTTNRDLDYLKAIGFTSIVPTIIRIPSFNSRPIREKIQLVLLFAHLEAKASNRSIKISRNILNCYIMSQYKNNLHQLRNEIRAALLTNMTSNMVSGNYMIQLDFEDLSDGLLENIIDVNNNLDELNLFYNTRPFEEIILEPNNSNSLMFLFDETNHDPVNVNYSDPSSVFITYLNQCKTLVENALDNAPSTLRCVEFAPLYDLLYPLLKNHVITSNENLLYGFFEYIQGLINAQHSETADEGDFLLHEFMDHKEYPTEQSLISALNTEYGLSLGNKELLFFHHYLFIAQSIIQNIYIPLLFIAKNPRISKAYVNLANSFAYDTGAFDLETSFLDTQFETIAFLTFIADKINEIDGGKGVLVIICDNFSEEFLNTLQSTARNSLIIKHFTITSIEEIMRLASKTTVFLPDFVNYSFETGAPADHDFSEQNVLDLLRDNLLNDSLTFLNPSKVLPCAYSVLQQIMRCLNIQYNENLVVRFIVHCSFMVERIIANDQLHYSNINKYIEDNAVVFHTIEQQCVPLNNLFGINIPQSEYVYLTDIVKDFIGDQPIG